jgi:hypothetical protein
MVDDLHPSAGVMFQGKDPEERFAFYFRQHWIRLVWPLLQMIFWTVVILTAGYFIFYVLEVPDITTRHGILLALLLIFTSIHIRFLVRLYTYFLYVIVMTDRKVHRIKKTLFSIDDHQSMDIWTFQDVQKQQHGFLQNILGYGSLVLEAQDTELRLHFVPRISEIHHKLSQIRERGRERMNKKLLPVELIQTNRSDTSVT